MKSMFIVAASALSLVALVAGCGAEQENTPNGYGYEFHDEDILALGATKTAPALDPVAPGTKIAPELVQRVVRAQADTLTACYNDALKRDPNARGKVTVHFEVLPDGAVEGATDGGSTVADHAMVSCVVEAVRKAPFPTSSAGRMTVIYPLVFSR